MWHSLAKTNKTFCENGITCLTGDVAAKGLDIMQHKWFTDM